MRLDELRFDETKYGDHRSQYLLRPDGMRARVWRYSFGYAYSHCYKWPGDIHVKQGDWNHSRDHDEFEIACLIADHLEDPDQTDFRGSASKLTQEVTDAAS